MILSVPYQPDFVNLLVKELSFLYDMGRAQYFSAEGNQNIFYVDLYMLKYNWYLNIML